MTVHSFSDIALVILQLLFFVALVLFVPVVPVLIARHSIRLMRAMTASNQEFMPVFAEGAASSEIASLNKLAGRVRYHENGCARCATDTRMPTTVLIFTLGGLALQLVSHSNTDAAALCVAFLLLWVGLATYHVLLAYALRLWFIVRTRSIEVHQAGPSPLKTLGWFVCLLGIPAVLVSTLTWSMVSAGIRPLLLAASACIVVRLLLAALKV